MVLKGKKKDQMFICDLIKGLFLSHLDTSQVFILLLGEPNNDVEGLLIDQRQIVHVDAYALALCLSQTAPCLTTRLLWFN